MISAVTAHNFKGATFTAPLGGLTLVVGPNGVGKSSRSQALQLAVLGYVPGTGKQNAAIMDAFHDGEGKDLRAGIVLASGHKIERRFSRSRSGKVSEELYAGGIKVRPDEFARALAGVGVVDLSVFLGLSDAKKIDELFRLFPPEGDVAGVSEKIERQTKRVNDLDRQEREAMTAVATVLSRRSKIELPAGTMADKMAEIEQAEADLAQARADLEAERIATARAEEQAKAEARQPELARGGVVGAPSFLAGDGPNIDLALFTDPPGSHALLPSNSTTPDLTATLERILSTMDKAGCDVCAARMVINRELAKARRGLPLEAVA
uniref:Rad50/SbcC-type AAA domain-containing protein n=1 Tax=Desulfovibrio sp. U5L TaxID=596152 RepID=I2Q066_9BACT